MANVTYAQLSEETTVVATDLLATYRGSGPLKRVLASTLLTYLAGATGFLKLDGSNSPMTGPLQFAAGNVGSPGASFASDADTGFYWISANKYGVATGGVQRGFWDSTGYTAAAPINYAAVADVVSATTTDIGALTSNYGRVTGTTTITGLGTAEAGVVRVLRFAAALTLTHNASSLILPGGANITTAAGDMAKFVSEGSGNWRCEWYSPAGALPVNRGGTGATVAATALSNLGGQPLDATLTALAGYNTNGILTQTAADTFTGRTLTGTAAEITVTNGSGVSGNPTLSLPSALTFTGKTVTGGTYSGAALNGTLGATTPSTVAATTIAASGNITQTGGVITTPNPVNVSSTNMLTGTFNGATYINYGTGGAADSLIFRAGSGFTQTAFISASGGLTMTGGVTATTGTFSGATTVGGAGWTTQALHAQGGALGWAVSGYNNSSGAGSGAFLARVDDVNRQLAGFFYTTTGVGSISTNGTTTAYNTSSDYRLKENVADLTDGLDRVLALRPRTFRWKSNGALDRGFIAHEIQAVLPNAVHGEKDAERRAVRAFPGEIVFPMKAVQVGECITTSDDAVMEPIYEYEPDYDAEPDVTVEWLEIDEMEPVYQGVDASKAMPDVIAAIQALHARIAALEAAQ